MINWYEAVAVITSLIFGSYAIAWCFPAIIILPVISLGSFKHIIFIDKQLAKNLDKYYTANGYMKPRYQLSSAIGTRFMGYCIAYPFIRHRIITDSVKFRVFMWVNSLGMWSWIILILSLTLLKCTGYVP